MSAILMSGLRSQRMGRMPALEKRHHSDTVDIGVTHSMQPEVMQPPLDKTVVMIKNGTGVKHDVIVVARST